MKTCENIQQAICAEQITPDIQEHLKKCPECQAFEQSLKVLLGKTVEIEPPAVLNETVLQFARENRPQAARTQAVFYFWLSVSAALLAFAFVVSRVLTQTPSKDDKITEIVPDKVVPEENPTKEVQVAVAVPTYEEIDSLLKDDLLLIEMGAIEGELFVLGSEFLN